MINPIPRSSFFGTPADLEGLDKMIKNLSTAHERSIAYQYTMHAFNLAYKMVEAEKAKEIANV